MFKKGEIIQHYDECDISYQHWAEHEIYEMHYGYWDATVKNHGESLTKRNQFLAEKMKISGGDRILDAGCGVGAISIWLAQKYNDAQITGISIAKEQINKAVGFAKKFKIDNNRVNFLERDFLNTSFGNNSFDIIFSIESMCHTENKIDFMKEAYGILKAGGKLVIGDYFLTKNELSNFEKKILHLHLDGWVVPNMVYGEKILNDLKAVGFKNVEYSDITANISPSSKIMFKRGVTGLFVDKIIKHKNKVQYANTITCFFQYITLKMGLWKYLIFYAEK